MRLAVYPTQTGGSPRLKGNFNTLDQRFFSESPFSLCQWRIHNKVSSEVYQVSLDCSQADNSLLCQNGYSMDQCLFGRYGVARGSIYVLCYDLCQPARSVSARLFEQAICSTRDPLFGFY